MAESFYTILTRTGLAKIANTQVSGGKVNISEMAVGDGAGSYYNPTIDDTSLKREVWRGAIGSVEIDKTNSNWIVIETVIPVIDGGFFVREVGLFDEAGDLIAIGKYPETYKPVLDEGSSKDLYIRMIIEVSNASAVTLKVDPAVIIASRKYVDEKIALAIGPVSQSIQQLQDALDEHKAEDSTDAHKIKNIAGLQAELDSRAKKQQEPWIDSVLQNGWVHGANRLQYFKDDFGIVYLQGEIKDGVIAKDTTLSTLPVGFHPKSSTPTSAYKANDGTFAGVVIGTDGAVLLHGLSVTGVLRINTSFRSV